ncbi:hypothetical protein DFH11DRAFT_1048280 [Phellopilus nigrolimitatus]|nr:hypothetical protein DFH11DRAFT_1048280 [Phellopilus nigrolimitatus]
MCAWSGEHAIPGGRSADGVRQRKGRQGESVVFVRAEKCRLSEDEAVGSLGWERATTPSRGGAQKRCTRRRKEGARVFVPFDLGDLRAQRLQRLSEVGMRTVRYTFNKLKEKLKKICCLPLSALRACLSVEDGPRGALEHFGFRSHVFLPFPLSIGLLSVHVWVRRSARRQALDRRQKVLGPARR